MIRLLAMLCLLALAPAPSRAQAPGDVLQEEAQDVGFQVSWGYNGTSMLAERWTPVRVHVWSGDRGVSGTLVIEYRQDASQSMRVVTPFSTTPGRAVPVEVTLPLPSGCQSIRFTLRDERGRRLRAHTFSRSSARDDAQMPQILSNTGVPLLNVGRTGIELVTTPIESESFAEDDRARFTAGAKPPDDLWSRLTIFDAAPGDMPSAWMGYDALGVVVLEAAQLASVSSVSLGALRQWVRAGGTLVLIADTPGDEWRSVLAHAGAASPVRLRPPAPIALHQRLEDVVELSPDLTGRPIEITEFGRRAGWTPRWDDPALDPVLVEGPVGLGWAIVTGVDPQRVPRVASDEQTGAIWREILRDTLDRHARERPDPNMYWGGFGYEPSGATPRQRAAISTILDHTLRAPPPGVGVFVVLIVAVLLLAVLVGPVDAIGLKLMRKRQHSWATALLYIAIACIPAALAPLLFRAGSTMHARSRCVDSLPAALGGDSVHTALSSTFAASPGPVRFVEPAPGSWWRPVSALRVWNTGSAAGGRLDCLQTSTATPAGLTRQCVPDERAGNTQRLWTLRTTMDQQPAAPRLSASLAPDLSAVRVTGLPAGCMIVSGALALPTRAPTPVRTEHWHELVPSAISAGSVELRLSDAGHDAEPPERWQPQHVPENEPWMWESSTGEYRPSRLADLPGAAERDRALRAYLASGAHALLLLEIEHDTPDTPLSVRSARTNVLEVHRIVITLPEASP